MFPSVCGFETNTTPCFLSAAEKIPVDHDPDDLHICNTSVLVVKSCADARGRNPHVESNTVDVGTDDDHSCVLADDHGRNRNPHDVDSNAEIDHRLTIVHVENSDNVKKQLKYHSCYSR